MGKRHKILNLMINQLELLSFYLSSLPLLNYQKYNNSNKIVKNMTKLQMMKKIDANGDGQLSLGELLSYNCDITYLKIELRK